MSRVITFGSFDIFHVGHLRLLERARSLGEQLIVGVSSDELTLAKKQRTPVYPLSERIAIIAGLRVVDEVFVEQALELKRHYLIAHRADVLVMGDDWARRFDDLADFCRVVYLPRTPSISTTATIERIRQ